MIMSFIKEADESVGMFQLKILNMDKKQSIPAGYIFPG